MGINFRALADENFVEHAPVEDEYLPPTCSYCGSPELESLGDNGRAARARCTACGGTMVTSGGTYAPDLPGQPDNHPSQDADPASGGVGGIGAGAPVVQLRTNDLSSKTAMPSRKYTPPAGLYFSHETHAPGSDMHDMMNEPGETRWDHHTLHAHLGDGPSVGEINYSTTNDGRNGLRIGGMLVATDHERKGIGSAMQDELRRRYPDHMFDHGSRTKAGEGWRAQYDDPGDPRLDLDHPDNVHEWKHYAGVDWCRHRHAEHCWLPRTDTTGPVALYTPQDRGICPWVTASQQQINCPMSEPGPMAGMTRAGKVDGP